MRIAISGLTKCGNTTVSKLVADALRLKRFNYTFRNMAEERKISLEKLHLLAQKTPAIDYALDEKQAKFALENENCLIASRLAVFLDDPKILKKLGLKKAPQFDLKVWLGVPLEERARRNAAKSGVSFSKALKEVKWRDGDNTKRYKKLYALDYSKLPPGVFTLDNSNITPQEAAGAIIRQANLSKKRWC